MWDQQEVGAWHGGPTYSCLFCCPCQFPGPLLNLFSCLTRTNCMNVLDGVRAAAEAQAEVPLPPMEDSLGAEFKQGAKAGPGAKSWMRLQVGLSRRLGAGARRARPPGSGCAGHPTHRLEDTMP